MPLIKATIVNNTIKSDEFDFTIGHIVLHNLADPIPALREMKLITKKDGYVVTIDPLYGNRYYYPSEEITRACDFLEQVQRYRCIERHEQMDGKSSHNPWNNFHSQLMEEVGLGKIHCYGWTSIFTLSDASYDFQMKKKWLKRRHQLAKNQQKEITSILLKTIMILELLVMPLRYSLAIRHN